MIRGSGRVINGFSNEIVSNFVLVGVLDFCFWLICRLSE